jgi:hypothetical protein
VLTYHNNNARDGLNATESILNRSNVNPSTFGKLFSHDVDGQVYAQPLYKSGVSIRGKGVHDVVFVATEHDSVYAFDAKNSRGRNAAPLWHVNFTGVTARSRRTVTVATTVPADDVYSIANGAPYGIADIKPEIGITGTPVIDPSTGTLYLVTTTKETQYGIPFGNVIGTRYVQRLHALNIHTGAEKFGGPVEINASVPGTGDGSVNGQVAFRPDNQLQRAGLLLLNGVVYIAWAGYGDRPPYHGWLIAYDAHNIRQQVGVFNTTPNGKMVLSTNGFPNPRESAGGGIWQGGGAPAADVEGNIYFTTGNGSFFDREVDYGGGFVRHSDLIPAGSARFVEALGRLTDGDPQEAGSFFYRNRVDVTNFSTRFEFQIRPGINPLADGITFTIQNNGPRALGSDGGGLGYYGIPSSVAVKFDTYNNAGEGDSSTGLYVDGRLPTVPVATAGWATSGIDFHSGHTFQVDLVYDGRLLTERIVDQDDPTRSFIHSYEIDIPGLVRGNQAYVGFTGGTGDLSAVQDINSWIYGHHVVDYGDSAVKLTSRNIVQAIDYFTPYNELDLDENDADLGSGGAVVVDLPGANPSHLLVFAGKNDVNIDRPGQDAGQRVARIYLADRGNLGQFHSDRNHILTTLTQPGGPGYFDTPAYFNHVIYYAGRGYPMQTFALTADAAGLPALVPAGQGTFPFRGQGATPSVSANGTQDGIVWALDVDPADPGGGRAVLRAFDASNVSRELYDSEVAGVRDRLDPGTKFSVPTVADGKVFVGTKGRLTVFGLLPGPGRPLDNVNPRGVARMAEAGPVKAVARGALST